MGRNLLNYVRMLKYDFWLLTQLFFCSILMTFHICVQVKLRESGVSSIGEQYRQKTLLKTFAVGIKTKILSRDCPEGVILRHGKTADTVSNNKEGVKCSNNDQWGYGVYLYSLNIYLVSEGDNYDSLNISIIESNKYVNYRD